MNLGGEELGDKQAVGNKTHKTEEERKQSMTVGLGRSSRNCKSSVT